MVHANQRQIHGHPDRPHLSLPEARSDNITSEGRRNRLRNRLTRNRTCKPRKSNHRSRIRQDPDRAQPILQKRHDKAECTRTEDMV
jgi:hypothetical protein